MLHATGASCYFWVILLTMTGRLLQRRWVWQGIICKNYSHLIIVIFKQGLCCYILYINFCFLCRLINYFHRTMWKLAFCTFSISASLFGWKFYKDSFRTYPTIWYLQKVGIWLYSALLLRYVRLRICVFADNLYRFSRQLQSFQTLISYCVNFIKWNSHTVGFTIL